MAFSQAVPAGPVLRKGPRLGSLRRQVVPYLFILPAGLVYFAFRLGPILVTVVMSFFRWNGIMPTGQFVGFRYYGFVLADPLFHNAISHNVIFLVLAVVVPVSIGFFLALFLSQVTALRTTFRAILFLPCIFGGVVVAYIWNWVYHPFSGLLNGALSAVGLDFLTTSWLGNTHIALYSIFVAYTWASYGYSMIFFLAGLQSIPPEHFDAAKIEGATLLQSIFYVILPSLRDVLTFVVTLRILTSLKQFEIPFVLTGGGPYFATDVMELYTYRFIADFQMGLASAAATLEAIIVCAIAVLFIRGRER
jgi:raffinose/stachyose/melibiose transport system permease protein